MRVAVQQQVRSRMWNLRWNMDKVDAQPFTMKIEHKGPLNAVAVTTHDPDARPDCADLIQHSLVTYIP